MRFELTSLVMVSQGFSLVSCQQSLLRVSSLYRGEKMAPSPVTPIQCP